MTNNAEPITGITIDTLVAFSQLQLTVVVGQELAATSRVSWAHATEMVDPRPHLRGSELVCTVGSMLLTPASCAQFVQAVHATASAGICLGIGEVHTKVPRALINECRRLAIPLLSMSHGVAFVAINDVLADARVTAQTGSSARNADLIATLLVSLRANAPVEAILDLAADTIGGEFVLNYSRDGNQLTWVGSPPEPDADLLAQITRIAEVALQEKMDRERQNRQRIGHLFALVAGGLADAAALVPEFQNILLVGMPLTISAWPAETASLLAQHLPDGLIADGPETTFAVVKTPEVVRELARELGLVCGYSSPVDTTQIARGIGEARAALVLARHNGSVSGPESLTSLTGLLEQQPQGRLVPFVEQLIAPIVVADGRRGSQLVDTLRTFVEHQGSIQETADARYLHVNTVRHRLARIRELVGRNPLDNRDRVSLEIALWAFDRGQRHSR